MLFVLQDKLKFFLKLLKFFRLNLLKGIDILPIIIYNNIVIQMIGGIL